MRAGGTLAGFTLCPPPCPQHCVDPYAPLLGSRFKKVTEGTATILFPDSEDGKPDGGDGEDSGDVENVFSLHGQLGAAQDTAEFDRNVPNTRLRGVYR